MRLVKLSIDNFLAIEHAELSIDRPVVFLQGAHMSGKTSVVNALEWCLTDRCRQLPTLKAVARAVPRDARRPTVVVAVFEQEGGELAVRRSLVDGKSELSLVEPGGVARDGTKPELQAQVNQMCGANELIHVLLDLDGFWQLDADGRRKVLHGLVGARPEESAVVEALARRGLEGRLADEAAVRVARVGFARAREAIVEIRRERKRALAELPEDPPEPIFREGDYTLDLRKPTFDQLQAAHQKLDAQLQAALGAQGLSRGRVEGELTAARQRLAELEGPLPVRPASILEIPDLEQQVAACEAELTACAEVIENAKHMLGQPDEPLPTVASDRPHCPVFDVQCLAAPSKIRNHLHQQRKARQPADPLVVEQVRAEKARAEERIQALNNSLESASERLAELITLRDRHDAEESAFHERASQRKLAQEAVGRLEQQLAQAEDHPAVDVGPLRARVQRGTRVLTAKAAFDQALQAYRKGVERRKLVEDQVVQADAIEKAFAPDAIPAELARESLKPFNARLHEALMVSLERGGVRVRDDLTIEFQVGEHWRDERTVSHSERLRLGWCIQYALAVFSPLRILVLDELSTLSQRLRGALADNWAGMAARPLDRVFMLAALQHDVPRLPPEGTQLAAHASFWWVHEGVVEKL